MIANSTGNGNEPTSYYVASPNELVETNETIVISNNVSTNRLLQQGKPNTTFENRIVETINESPAVGDRNKQISMYTDQIGDLSVFNYAASSASPDAFSGQPVSTSTLSSTTARSAANKIHYDFLNSNNLPLPPIREQASAFGSSSNQPLFSQQSPFGPNPASKLLPPIDDLIEFRLNGSTPFSKFNKFTDKTTSSTNSPISSSSSTTPNSPPSSQQQQLNQMTPTPATMERSAGAASMLASGESAIDSMPELYNAPLSSFASTLQQVNQQANQQAKLKQSNDKSLHLNTNTIPKNGPISETPANQTEHPTAPNGENRYRWVSNYNSRNKLPPYPPKQPAVPGETVRSGIIFCLSLSYASL